MTQPEQGIYGGVDTHRDVHVAAVVNETGRILDVGSFPATGAGYSRLLAWMRGYGPVVRVGVEGTGSYGAGVARHLEGAGVAVVEVNRPNRQARRRRGKNDTTDAEAAARAALNGEATAAPKAGSGIVESLRVLRVARRSALKARTQAANQIRDLIVTAPDPLRERLRDLDCDGRVAICAGFRPGPQRDPMATTKHTLRLLARRHQALTAELEDLDTAITQLCAETNPALLGARGVGPDVASTLLVAAGDNPHRMRNEAGFAALCGANPIEASSGKTVRHRLNRGGNRDANHALYCIVMVRLRCDQRTQQYAARRRAEGKTDRDIVRCLKRYVAREIYQLLTDPPTVPTGADLRATRTAAGITLADAAHALSTWPTRISQLERGLKHDTDLATRYQHWLTQHAA